MEEETNDREREDGGTSNRLVYTRVRTSHCLDQLVLIHSFPPTPSIDGWLQYITIQSLEETIAVYKLNLLCICYVSALMVIEYLA